MDAHNDDTFGKRRREGKRAGCRKMETAASERMPDDDDGFVLFPERKHAHFHSLLQLPSFTGGDGDFATADIGGASVSKQREKKEGKKIDAHSATTSTSMMMTTTERPAAKKKSITNSRRPCCALRAPLSSILELP